MVSDDQTKNNIAENLRRILESRGLEQKFLADATGENQMTISRIVRGKNVPGAGVLARIAEALDVSIDRLVQAPPESVKNSQ